MNKQLILIITLMMIPQVFAATLEDSVWPTGNSTTSDDINDAFGPRIAPGVVYDFHRGIDFLQPEGTPIVAVMNGTVVRMETAVENNGTGRERFGNWVCINHTGWPGEPGVTRMTTYFHMSDFSPTITEGTVVTKGDIIGFVGHSGEGINTNHLHLELHRNATGACSYSNLKARNAMKVLPYTDLNVLNVTVTESPAGQYRIKVSLPADQNELDFNRIEIYGSSASRIIDYDLRTGIDPANNDNPSYNGVTITPDNYTHSHGWWNVTYNTSSSVIGTLQHVTLYDTNGNLLANTSYNPPFLESFVDFSAWTESGETDWRASVPDEGQIPGFPAGNTAAEADDCDTNCTLTMTNSVNLSGKSAATAKFWRLVDNDIDTGEYLKIDAYDGSSWNQIFYWTQGSGDDGNWHYETWNMPGSYLTSNFKMRFVTKSSTASEEVEVDELLIEAE